MRDNIAKAAAAKVPNVITFSGNRRDSPTTKAATPASSAQARSQNSRGCRHHICLELLNSKVDHKDYQCDHTNGGLTCARAWVHRRVKLLYDIYQCRSSEGDR